MKRSITLFLVLAGCVERDAAGVPMNRGSALCENVAGAEAIAWDYYNGVPVTDSVIPPPLPLGGQYIHPSFPLLGFLHPAGFEPFTYNDAFTVGVDLVRNDQRAVWRYLYMTLNSQPTASEMLNIELDLVRSFFGTNNLTVVCQRRASGDPGTGTIATSASVLVRSADQTALVALYVTPLPGLNSAGLYLRTMAAPTVEFPERALDTFIAIDWQFLVGDSVDPIDSDGDGWFDDLDEFPNDPTRH